MSHVFQATGILKVLVIGWTYKGGHSARSSIMSETVSGQAPGIPYKMKVETSKKVSEWVKERKPREFLLLLLVLGLAAALEWK